MQFGSQEVAMRRSIITKDESEFEIIREPEHAKKIYDAVVRNFGRYYDSWIKENSASAALEKLAEKFRVKAAKRNDKGTLEEIFQRDVSDFVKKQAKYEKFFEREALQEYQDDD